MSVIKNINILRGVMTNILTYSLNEGFKGSWKGALLGGSVGLASGYYIANEAVKKDPSSGLIAGITLVAFPMGGLFAGTFAGFVAGSTIGLGNWLINGPFEYNPADELSINVGIGLTAAITEFFSKED